MRFFHLSDLHIGLKLFNRDLLEDQRFILGQVVDWATKEKPDAVVIAGDIYDRAVPSAEAVTVFDGFLSGLTQALPEAVVMIISGNHDSAPRVNAFRSVLSRQRIYMIGNPPEKPEDHIEKVTLQDAFGRINFYLLPFVKPSMARMILETEENGGALSYNDTVHRMIGREEIDFTERNVLVSHQFYLPTGADADKVDRMDSEICTLGNIDEVRADVLEGFDYAALGHIHKPMKVGSEVFRYCGTPLACSLSEAGQAKGIVMVDMGEKGDVKTKVLPLTPLRRVCVLQGTLGEVLGQGCGDYVSVILTDEEDLDVADMQDRLRSAFPNLLEIRRQGIKRADYCEEFQAEAVLDPLELCGAFLGDMDDSEQELLRDVIAAVQTGC